MRYNLLHKNNIVFYVSPLSSETLPAGSNWGPFFILLSLFLITYQLQSNLEKHWWGSLLLLLGLVLIRIVLYETIWPDNWLLSDWFSAGFFAFNEWYPDFFAYSINSLFIVFGFRITLALIRLTDSPWTKLFALLIPLTFWLSILHLLSLAIAHSNIPLSFEHLFELRLSSYFFFALMGFYLYTFQKTIYVILQLNQQNPRLKHWAWKPAILFIPFVCLLIFDANWMDALPLIVILIHLVFYNTKERSWSKLSSQLLILTVNAAIISLYLQKLQDDIKPFSSLIARKIIESEYWLSSDPKPFPS